VGDDLGDGLRVYHGLCQLSVVCHVLLLGAMCCGVLIEVLAVVTGMLIGFA
jgi:hypothetical protein